MESLSVGGLASGLDTNAIIDGLTNLEMLKVTRIEDKQRDVELKLSAFNDLRQYISDFADSASKLDDIKAFNLFSSESSDEDRATITGDEDAISGSYEIEIGSLAQELKVTSNSYSGMVDPLGLTGKFEISVSQSALEGDPITTAVEIEVDAGDSLKSLVTKINAAEGVGVSASIISLGADDYRLVLSGVDEGTEGFSMKDTGGANILDGGGLGFLDYTQRVQSDFNLRLDSIGAADSATLFSELFAGIGAASAVDAGDQIQITGNDANGNAVAGAFTVAAASSVQDLLNQVKTVYEAGGTTVDVALNESGEIVITDTSGGLQEMSMAMTLDDVNASGSEMQLSSVGDTGKVQNVYTNVLTEGKKAFFAIDGLSVASESNQAEGIVSGTEFNLKKAELGEVIELSLERDSELIKEKIQGFVDNFNTVMSFLDTKSKVEINEGNENDPTSKASLGAKGPFAGETSISRIKTDLRNMMTNAIDELNSKSQYTSLASIGITSNGTSGQLSIDDDRFDKAITQDFEGVRRLFISSGFSTNTNHSLGRYGEDAQTGVYEIDADNDLFDEDGSAGTSMQAATRIGDILTSNTGGSSTLTLDAPAGSGTGTFTFVRGIAGQISQYWDQVTDTFDGHLSQTRESFESRIESYKDRAEKMSGKVEMFRQRLIRQFAGLEDAMSRLQSQSAAFQSQIGSL